MADILGARRDMAPLRAGSGGTFAADGLAWALSAGAMLLLLISPALWNGFPLIFPDTGGYLDRPMLGTLGMGRAAIYGAFLYPGVPFSFWPNIVVQSAVAAWLIVLTLRSHGLGERPWLALGIVALLTIATSLPWFAAQLMPDILFAAAALALHLLVFRDDALQAYERWALAAIVAVAIPSHMAAAGMCVGLLLALALLTRVRRLDLPKARLSFAAGAVAAGLALCPVSNYAITGQFALTPGGSSFLFGRLVEAGIVQRYLDDKCPDANLRLCAFSAALPKDADGWLWDPSSPFRKLKNFEGSAEESAIIRDTLVLYPVTQLRAALTATARQLVKFKTEVNGTDNEPTIMMFKEHTPALYPQFMQARQQSPGFNVGAINAVHVPVAALAIAGLGAALALRRRIGLPDPLAALAVTIGVALFANAAICAVFSHPVDRYQSRLAWLAVLAAAMIAAHFGRSRFPAAPR